MVGTTSDDPEVRSSASVRHHLGNLLFALFAIGVASVVAIWNAERASARSLDGVASAMGLPLEPGSTFSTGMAANRLADLEELGRGPLWLSSERQAVWALFDPSVMQPYPNHKKDSHCLLLFLHQERTLLARSLRAQVALVGEVPVAFTQHVCGLLQDAGVPFTIEE